MGADWVEHLYADPDRAEFPPVPTEHKRPLYHHDHPDTPLQAVMEATPGEAEQVSVAELWELREVLVDAFEELDEREQWVLNALVIEGQSHRQLSAELALSPRQIRRIRDAAVDQLKMRLQSNKLVTDHLEGR